MPPLPPSSMVPPVASEDDQHADQHADQHDDQQDGHDDVLVDTSSVVLFDLPPSLPRPWTTATTTTPTTNEDDPVDNNDDQDHDDDDTERRVIHHDEVSSYTSATSASTVSSHEGGIVDDVDDDDRVAAAVAPPPTGRHGTRPRSASLHILATVAAPATGTLRAGSLSRERASSHGRRRARTRTPLRQESPLLILRRPENGEVGDGRERRALSFADGDGEVAAASPVGTTATATADAAAAVGNDDVHVQDDDNYASVEGQAERRNRNRTRHAIPEVAHEEEEEEEQQRQQPEQQPEQQQPEPTRRTNDNPTASTRAGHWLSRAAVAPAPSTSTSTSSRRRPRSSHPTRSRLSTLSAKQRPSHRKLRRWNNDRFVDLDRVAGTALDELYHHPADNDRDDDPTGHHLYWKEHYMPNYPLRYRSAFAALARDDTVVGTTARERFVKGEVGKPPVSMGGDGPADWRRMAGKLLEESNGNDHDKDKEREKILASCMEREIVAKLRKMGVADAPALVRTDPSSRLGNELFRSLAPRVRAVLSKSCRYSSSTTSAFSSTPISSPSHPSSQSSSSTPADTTSSSSSSSLSAERIVHALESYLVSLTHGISHVHHVPDPSVLDVLRRILASPPRIVLKNRHPLFRGHGGAVVPTVHFHFAMDDDEQNDGAASSSQPHRQRRKQKKESSRSGAFHRILLHAVCRFHGLETSSTVRTHRDERDVVKAVTVQGGILLAPSLRVLEFVEES